MTRADLAIPAAQGHPGPTAERASSATGGHGASWQQEMERAQTEMWLRGRGIAPAAIAAGAFSLPVRPDDPPLPSLNEAQRHEAAAAQAAPMQPDDTKSHHDVGHSVSSRDRLTSVTSQTLPEADRGLATRLDPATPQTREDDAGLDQATSSHLGVRTKDAPSQEAPVRPPGQAHVAIPATPINPSRPITTAWRSGGLPALAEVRIALQAGEVDGQVATPAVQATWAPSPRIARLTEAALHVQPAAETTRAALEQAVQKASAQPPVRVQAGLNGTQVCIWLGVDAAVALDVQALLARLKPVLEREGLKLQRVICNGETAFEADAPTETDFTNGEPRP